MMASLTPPLLRELYLRLRGRSGCAYGLSGDYLSWEEALRAGTGYHSESILEKTRVALLKVKDGEAAFERDSVLFKKPEYSWHLLAPLMWVAAQCGGRLDVLDYGGSLGSTYFQHRTFLGRLKELRWNVVEQAAHVQAGKEWFEDGELRFHAGIEECLAQSRPNVVLLGSVLQYLERPHELLRQLLSLPCAHLIIDRTPFWEGDRDRLCLQQVPPSIYPGSYPCWIFARSRFRDSVERKWELLAEFDNDDYLPAPVEIKWQGMLLSRSPA